MKTPPDFYPLVGKAEFYYSVPENDDPKQKPTQLVEGENLRHARSAQYYYVSSKIKSNACPKRIAIGCVAFIAIFFEGCSRIKREPFQGDRVTYVTTRKTLVKFSDISLA